MSEVGNPRIVVVVGGSRGIGLAITRRFAENGDIVVVSARRPRPEIDELAGAELVALDMTTPDGPDKFIKHVVEKYGRIDVLINCVGGSIIRADPLALTDDDWMKMLTSSFFYAVRSCRAAIPHIPKHGSGIIINISSTVAQNPVPITIDYCSAKAALEAYSKTISMVLAPQGIRVMTIIPGPVMTPGWTDPGGWAEQLQPIFGFSTPKEVLEASAKALPLGRFTDPAEVGALAFFVASREAPTMTGSTLRIDAGSSAHV